MDIIVKILISLLLLLYLLTFFVYSKSIIYQFNYKNRNVYGKSMMNDFKFKNSLYCYNNINYFDKFYGVEIDDCFPQ